MLSEPVLVVANLARVFDALGIRYVVGGSLASSIYGIPRATQDVDLGRMVARHLADRLDVDRQEQIGPGISPHPANTSPADPHSITPRQQAW